eukprot:2503146-Pyramimonas_sp.AAC.1
MPAHTANTLRAHHELHTCALSNRRCCNGDVRGGGRCVLYWVGGWTGGHTTRVSNKKLQLVMDARAKGWSPYFQAALDSPGGGHMEAWPFWHRKVQRSRSFLPSAR